MYKLLLAFLLLLAASLQQSQPELDSSCSLPVLIPCPPENYCTNASTIIVLQDTSFNCSTPLNLTAENIIFEGGLMTGVVNLVADLVEIDGLTIIGNLSILCNIRLIYR